MRSLYDHLSHHIPHDTTMSTHRGRHRLIAYGPHTYTTPSCITITDGHQECERFTRALIYDACESWTQRLQEEDTKYLLLNTMHTTSYLLSICTLSYRCLSSYLLLCRAISAELFPIIPRNSQRPLLQVPSHPHMMRFWYDFHTYRRQDQCQS